jgi:hypothetical protein
MASPQIFGNDRNGPVAESVDARTVQRSLSWFKSRPGLQPSLLRSFGQQANPWRQAGIPQDVKLARNPG